MLAGNLVAGWQMGRALLAAEQLLHKGQDAAFMRAKIATARFYAEHILVKAAGLRDAIDRKSTRLNSSHLVISYAVFCLKKKKNNRVPHADRLAYKTSYTVVRTG